MFRRAFEDDPPHITFSADWHQWSYGRLRPGTTVAVSYDPNRLPEERSTYNGAPTWSIVAFHQFAPDRPVMGQPLETPTGQVVRRYSDEPYEATMMTTSIDIPEDAEELILWFMNTGQSGQQYWDSDFGRNYAFRFTAIDIQGEHATVVSDPQTPFASFEVEISALVAIDSVAVNFEVTNAPREHPFGGTVPLQRGELVNGRREWAARGISVPRGANIRFSFSYTVGGRSFLDENDGAGFYAPKPLPTHRPEAFLAALAAREQR